MTASTSPLFASLLPLQESDLHVSFFLEKPEHQRSLENFHSRFRFGNDGERF